MAAISLLMNVLVHKWWQMFGASTVWVTSFVIVCNCQCQHQTMDKSRLKAAHTGMLYYSLTEWTLSFCICEWRWIWCMGWSQLSSPQWDWWGSEMWLWPPHPFCHSAGEWCHSWFLTVSMCAFMTLFSLAYSKQGFCAHYIFLISLCIAQLGLMQCLSIDLLCP